MDFHPQKGLAVCGLACALCGEKDCPGCAQRGCREVDDCPVYACAARKGLKGCYQCAQLPCEKEMVTRVRNRAFLEYARRHGVQALMDKLKFNAQKGIVYHAPNSLLGDYDAPATVEGVIRLIEEGAAETGTP